MAGMALTPKQFLVALAVYFVASLLASRLPPTSRGSEILQGLLFDFRKVLGLDLSVPKPTAAAPVTTVAAQAAPVADPTTRPATPAATPVSPTPPTPPTAS